MSDFFNEEQLSKVAFDLLACSTFDRYQRIAKRSSKEMVTTRLKADPEIAGTLIHEARILWEELLRGKERGIAEIKLATLLPALRDMASPAADSLLTTVAVCEMPVSVWISALARKLRAERPHQYAP